MHLASVPSLNDVQERSLVRQMGTTAKLTLLRRIAKDYLEVADSKRVGQVADLIGKVAEQRNDLVHGLYVHDPDDMSPAVLTFSGAARIRSKPKKVSPRELELFIVQLNHASKELAAICPLFPVIDKVPPEETRPISARPRDHS